MQWSQWDTLHASFLSEQVREKAYAFANVCAGEHVPILDATVDHAFVNMYLHHDEDPSKAIREMTRIVKSGGKIIITGLDEHAFEFLRSEQHDRWMGFRREEMRQWFVGAGSKNVQVDGVGTNRCADSCCGSEHARVSLLVDSGEK